MSLQAATRAVAQAVAPYLPAAVNGVLDKIDDAFAAPTGFGATLLVLLTFYVLAKILTSLVLGDGKTRRKRSGDTILFVGLSGSGKTLIFNKLCFGTNPQTVTSTAQAIVKQPLYDADADSADDSRQQYTFVDYPGHPRLRGRALYRHAGQSRAVIFVVDATSTDNDSFRRVAELLYDLFTNVQFVEQLPPLLIACNKSDQDGAASIDVIRGKLEKALEMLKNTRASLGTTNEDEQTLRLGRAGQPFAFNVDSPGDVEFCASSAKNDGGLSAIRSFIETCFDRD